MNYNRSNGSQFNKWDKDPDHVENKKKLVSDLMALRRMKLIKSAQTRSSTYLDLSFANNSLVSTIGNSEVKPLLEGTLLKDELDVMYGNSSLKRATEHFATLHSDQPNNAEECEIKRRHFLSDVTSKRKGELEESRKSRQQKQHQLVIKQEELNELVKGSLRRPFNVNELVADTEQNLKAMEHNLKYLKIKYGKTVPKKRTILQNSVSFEYFRKAHAEQVKIAEWIIEDIVLEKVFSITQVGNADYELLQTALIADHQQWEDYQLETTKYEAALFCLDEIVSEVSQEIVENICKECLRLYQLCIVVSEDIVISSVNSTLPKSKITNKIVDETWCGIKSSRGRTRKGIWNRTQTTIREHEPEGKPSPDAAKKTQPPVIVPVTEDHDAETISSEHMVPKMTSLFGKLPEMKDYSNDERSLWSHFTVDSPEFSYSTKPMLKISITALNCDHSYLALGSQRGDLIVYNMLWQPSKLIRCVACHSKEIDPVTQIKWSFDSSRLLTLRESGCLIVWSFAFAPYASNTDLVRLEYNQPAGDVLCQQLTALCILEARRGDFIFLEGPLAENDKAVSSISVNGCYFDNTLSPAASQDHVVVTLVNGDILRCDLSEIVRQRCSDDLMLGITKSFQPSKHILGNSTLKTDKVHKISRGIVTELFRHHRAKVVEIIFVGVTGDMISLDSNSNLLHWKHDQENFNNFGWFVPFKKCKLAFEEEVFMPKGDDTVIFEDRVALKIASKGRRAKSKHIIEQERKSALLLLEDITRSSAWHSDETPDEIDADEKQKKKKFITRIYAPRSNHLIDISAGGATFHVVMLKRDTNTLVKYLQRTYESSNITSVALLHWALDQTANRIFFMLLFDEYLPKVRKHVTIVDFDVSDFQFGKLGSIQINLKSDIYLKIMSGRASHFSVSRVNEFTGSEYILCNIAGSLHMYSILSGQRVLYGTTEKSKLASIPGLKLIPKLSRISPDSKVIIVYPNGITMFVIIVPQVNIYANTRIIILGDKDPSVFRRNVLAKYKALLYSDDKDKGIAGWCPPEQNCHREIWTHRELPLSVYVKMVIYKIVDVAVARATGERMNQDVRKAVWQSDWLHMQELFSD